MVWNPFKEKKNVPFIGMLDETTREGLNKAFIPQFLYKPPFGYPRFSNLPYVRYLAATPYVEMCIDTLLNGVMSVEWVILPNPDVEENVYYDEKGDFRKDVRNEISHIKSFLENPNTNKETFEDVFVKQALRDVLEVNTGILNKVFNLKQEMVEVVARDGISFTKNPDIHGMYTNRKDILISKEITDVEPVQNPFQQINQRLVTEEAAYFQYGWIAGPMPVPFGKREIIWLQKMLRSNDIYGYSPVQYLAKALQMLLYHIESDLEYFNDNNIPKGIIGLDASDTDEIKAFRDQWNEMQIKKDEFGNNKKIMNKVPIMNYIPKFERIEFSSSEIQMIEKQKWYSKMVWAAFGVTATELGYTEDAAGMANQIVQSKVFRKKGVNPLLRMLEQAINKEVLPEFKYSVSISSGSRELALPKYVFRYSMFDIDEEKSKYELYKLQTENGLRTVNEVREEDGLDPVSWGDEPPRSFLAGGSSFSFGDSFGDKDSNSRTNVNTSKVPNTRNPQKDNEKVSKEVSGKGEGKAQSVDTPLVLKENERLDSERLIKALKSLLEDSRNSILKVLKEEMRPDVLKQVKNADEFDFDKVEIKSLSDLIERVKGFVQLDRVKSVLFGVIRAYFLKGSEEAELRINDIQPFNYSPDSKAIDYISNYTFENVKGMNDEISEDLRREFKIGLMNGEGLDKLRDRVMKVFDVSKNRSETIVRTEVNRAYSHGKYQAYKQSGVKARKWLLWTNDHRTSEITKALHAKYGSSEKSIPLDENFKVTVTVGKKQVVIDQLVGPFHPNERDDLIIEPFL